MAAAAEGASIVRFRCYRRREQESDPADMRLLRLLLGDGARRELRDRSCSCPARYDSGPSAAVLQ